MPKFSEMKVATKLYTGFGVIVALLMFSGCIAYYALNNLSNRMDDVIHDKVSKVEWVADINYNVLDIARSMRNALLEIDHPEKMEAQIQAALNARAKIKVIVEKIEPLLHHPEGQAIMKQILSARSNFIEGQEVIFRLLREKKASEAREYLLTEMRQRQATYADATRALQDFQRKLMKDSGEAASQEVSQAILFIVIALIFSLAFSVVVASMIVRNLVAQLGGEPAYAAENVKYIAEGNLTHRIETRHGDSSSLLISLKNMQSGLSTLVNEINEVVLAASNGDFTKRVNIAGKQGFGRDIGGALNQLLETTNAGLSDIVRVSQALAEGDLSQKIEKNYPGVFGQTSTAVNATVTSLSLIVADIDQMVQCANQGNFSARIDLYDKKGFAHELSSLLNKLSETTENGLTDIMRVANTLADGDLTQTIDADYPGLFGETSAGINATVTNLTILIRQLKDAVEAINTASTEIAAGNVDLSSRTEEQASSLEQTSSSMEELNATVKNNTESALKANQLAKSSNDIAVQGGLMVKSVVATMSDIEASSKKIADIIGVIDGIAFQTNILALNAAVEAARAGEQGRGFAVVATEVRSLAQRSATAAKEIKDLITESVHKVEDGSKLVRDAGNTMDEVVTSFQGVADLVTEISSASREQSSGIEQVTLAVSQMDEVTQQNAALVEEAAAAAESLEEQAQGLMQAVAKFKLAS